MCGSPRLSKFTVAPAASGASMVPLRSGNGRHAYQ
jgi:hypothetical protein